MFLIDVSPSMGSRREVQVPSTAEGQEVTIEMTNLEWSLQFVKMKIQEMVRALTYLYLQY
jgi:ATP-dependent DNA helicase 2 subunit 2